MKHSMTTKCLFLVLCVATFCLTNSQDTNTMPPASLLCISECNTCPVICSTPPPSTIKLNPPPSPSTSILVQTPPPPPPLFAPLRPSPPSSHSPSPPSSSQKEPKSPPPSYMIYTGAPPPPHTSNCPPNIINIPSTQVPPVQKNYTYPYYYYFASEATSIPLFHGSIVLGFWVVFHLICW
uniref:Extensin domain-containing protein n=1 Tax=Solanum lycopersicum TaxID=4081 RepID=A0A3Q7HQ15_SOLLC|nr:proline-rich receptor-like protein kinase PERK8 [Solanum lycopersicum]